jgi:hypothetical protein
LARDFEETLNLDYVLKNSAAYRDVEEIVETGPNAFVEVCMNDIGSAGYDAGT